MPSTDAVQFLASSGDRLRLLQSLFDGASTPAELASEHALSRRSIQRHLAEFVERGWAESSGGTYQLTVTGALVMEAHTEYVEELAQLSEYAPFFRHLPDRERAPDPSWLTDATLTVATEEDPQAPVHEYVRRVTQLETDRVRMLAPVLSRLFHEAHATVARRGVHTVLVMPAPMVHRAEDRNPLEFSVIARLDVLSLYESPEAFEFGLTLGDDVVLMAAYDGDNQMRALVESTAPPFHDWSAELFDRYQQQATLVDA
jgi:predicted transcriptional regulator